MDEQPFVLGESIFGWSEGDQQELEDDGPGEPIRQTFQWKVP